MASDIPATLLKQLDVTRFAKRSAQLQKLKPAISYWCMSRGPDPKR